MLKSKLIIKIDASKWLSVLDFLKGYKPPGYKNSGLQWRHIKSDGERSNFKKIPTHTQDHGDA